MDRHDATTVILILFTLMILGGLGYIAYSGITSPHGPAAVYH